MSLAYFAILTATAALAWWLSGFDSALTGQDETADFKRRAVRVGITMLLMAVGASSLLNGVGWLFVAIVLPLGIIWAGCLSEVFSGGLHRLIDSPDDREFNPKQLSRDLDKLAVLVQQGQNEEAIELCHRLMESGEASALAMETMLFQLCRQTFDGDWIPTSPPLAEAHRLREQGRFPEAESRLNLLLKQEPGNLAAMLMLMRLYAGDLRRPGQTGALLQTVGRQPQVPQAFIQYARRSIDEWNGRVPPKEKIAGGIESLLVDSQHAKAPENAINPNKASIDELLANGHLATAIEILEAKIGGQPRDFELWMKLAEAHGVHCSDLRRATKIVEMMSANAAFSPEQIQLAKAKLEEWRASSRS